MKKIYFFDDNENTIHDFNICLPEVITGLVQPPGPDGNGGLTLNDIRSITRFKFNPCDVVIFDWDLTLSVRNGLLLREDLLDDYAFYFAGGAERLRALNRMFVKFRTERVFVFVLTDNPCAANKEQRLLFTKLIRRFDPFFTLNYLVYGHGQKAVVFQINPLIQLATTVTWTEPKGPPPEMVKKNGPPKTAPSSKK